MMATKRSGEVMPNDSSAAEHVGQIGTFARFILLVRTVSDPHCWVDIVYI